MTIKEKIVNVGIALILIAVNVVLWSWVIRWADARWR